MEQAMLGIITTIACNIVIYVMLGASHWHRSRLDVVNFMQLKNDVYRRIATKLIGKGNDTTKFKIGDKTKKFFLKNGTYMKGGNIVYDIDMDTGKSLHFGSTKATGFSPEDLDTMYSKRILDKIAQFLNPQNSMGLLIIILPVVFLAIGIAGGWFMHGQSVKIITENRYIYENLPLTIG